MCTELLIDNPGMLSNSIHWLGKFFYVDFRHLRHLVFKES